MEEVSIRVIQEWEYWRTEGPFETSLYVDIKFGKQLHGLGRKEDEIRKIAGGGEK
jgi:hypothetical protein